MMMNMVPIPLRSEFIFTQVLLLLLIVVVTRNRYHVGTGRWTLFDIVN